ncbi:MAG: hypothetical protein QOG13_2402 [Sphingomonadales bacterium]|jgi:hypothetical protein|nr:hypothetical protein [Sphingomonadales bacterium]MEA3043529.1 hypothetical protein [Sphingomonadales bacterium]
MNRTALLIAGFAGLALAAAAAMANDSSAEKAAGGLVLRQNRDIDMVSEDLFVSAEQVRVRYVFRNRAPRAQRVTVAFPMPDRDLAYEMDSEVSYPDDFRTIVDGRPVGMEVERKAMVGGVDRSAELARLGIPVAPPRGERAGFLADAIGRLPAAAQQRLAQAGLIDAASLADPSHQVLPMWTVRETWYWDQIFPAGRALNVEHRYRPGVGGTAGVPLATAGYRNGEDGRREQADYCTDAAFLAALDRMTRRAERDRASYPMEQRIRYILTTGGNWRAPIGDFRLVVDKGRPDAIVSFCGEGVRRISPTQFEVRHRNWRPDRDLAILIVSAEPRE